jgi:histidinol dehydrogenase
MRTVLLEALDPGERRRLVRRSAVPDPAVKAAALEICSAVKADGQAVPELAARFGGGFRRLTPTEMEAAVGDLDPEVRKALESAAAAIEAFHSHQLPITSTSVTAPGVEVTRRWSPLNRVGAYIPGGTAPLPSTALMTVVPARLAGVREIVAVSPAVKDLPDPMVVAAATLAGATEVWALGGAQAIAALAYGAPGLRPVDKVVGPGNAWVTAAKLAVFGDVGIDLPAGPSEVLVLADETSDPRLVAIDLLCQAEHGPDSPAVLVTTDPDLPARVSEQISSFLPLLERRTVLEETLTRHAVAVIAPDREEAIRFTNQYAAEHVSVATADPEATAGAVTAAGSVYIGRWAAESAGDYATGANHVLPTGGMAAAAGPLAVEDFGSWRQEQRLTRSGLDALVPTITALATAEGLTAHALAASVRFEETTP